MLSPKLTTAILDAGADEVTIASTWGLSALALQGVTFASLFTEKALIALAVAELVYVGNWARSYRKTGDPTPPAPAMAALSARVDAIEAGHWQPAPPLPLPLPPLSGRLVDSAGVALLPIGTGAVTDTSLVSTTTPT